MNDKDKKQEGQPDEKIHIDKNIFEVSREEAERKAEEQERAAAEWRRKEEEERDRRLEAERLELLRLKQGIIQESEIIPEDVEEEAVRLPLFKKIGNFFYQNMWWLWLAVVFAAILTYLIIQLIMKPRPDMIFLIIGESYEISEVSQIEDYFASFADDYNDNGEILASMCYIPYTGNGQADYINSVDSKLTLELQSADAIIIIGDKLSADVLSDDSLVDLSEIYPGNEHIDGCKFMLSGTDFARKIGLEDGQLSDDWYISLRKPKKLSYDDLEEMQKVYDRDFVVFDSIVKDLT